MSTIFPASGDGTSIAAFQIQEQLMDHQLKSHPFFTQTSITSTSLHHQDQELVQFFSNYTSHGFGLSFLMPNFLYIEFSFFCSYDF